MGTLGDYLRSAREARGLDVRDVAQQTRISINYLKALEDEDFAKLPGEVFVKGFLRNYARFLNLPEPEVLKRYAETIPPAGGAPAAAAPSAPEPAAEPRAVEPHRAVAAPAEEPQAASKPSLEPFLWGVVILAALVAFIFTTLPAGKHPPAEQPAAPAQPGTAVSGEPAAPAVVQPAKPEKLYLDIIALEDLWVLVRTDASPQKKAVLKQGETVTWSADERFLLSYGSIGAARLVLNGKELAVQGPRSAVVRDLVITASGIVQQKVETEQPKPRKPQLQTQQTTTPTSAATPSPPPVQRPAPAPAAPAPPVVVPPQE